MPDEPNYKPRTDEEQASAKKQKWGHVFHEIFFNRGSLVKQISTFLTQNYLNDLLQRG